MEAELSGGAPQGVGTETSSRAGAAWSGHDGRAVADVVAAVKAAGMSGEVRYGGVRVRFSGVSQTLTWRRRLQLCSILPSTYV